MSFGRQARQNKSFENRAELLYLYSSLCLQWHRKTFEAMFEWGIIVAAQTNQTNQTYTRGRDSELNPAPLRGHSSSAVIKEYCLDIKQGSLQIRCKGDNATMIF